MTVTKSLADHYACPLCRPGRTREFDDLRALSNHINHVHGPLPGMTKRHVTVVLTESVIHMVNSVSKLLYDSRSDFIRTAIINQLGHDRRLLAGDEDVDDFTPAELRVLVAGYDYEVTR